MATLCWNMAGTKASLYGQENDDPIAQGISGAGGIGEELRQLVVVENFYLLACHLTLDAESLNRAQLVVNERIRSKSQNF